MIGDGSIWLDIARRAGDSWKLLEIAGMVGSGRLRQTFFTYFNPALPGRIRVDIGGLFTFVCVLTIYSFKIS